MTITVKMHRDPETLGAPRLHDIVLVNDIACCGYSWCTGGCGFPAGVIPASAEHPHEQKVFGVMTACGPVMQRFRDEWKGTRYVIPDEYHDELRKKWWL